LLVLCAVAVAEQFVLWCSQRSVDLPHSHEKQAQIQETKELGCVKPFLKHREVKCFFLEHFSESESISATLLKAALE